MSKIFWFDHFNWQLEKVWKSGLELIVPHNFEDVALLSSNIQCYQVIQYLADSYMLNLSLYLIGSLILELSSFEISQ